MASFWCAATSRVGRQAAQPALTPSAELGRKTVSKAVLAEAPAFVRLYDVLIDGGEDLREQPWTSAAPGLKH